MAVDIVVPPLGESVTEATIAKWFKKAGESVTQDEPLVELETDKVTLEVNAPASGALKEIKAPEGSTVEVGALLGRIEAGAKGAIAPKDSGSRIQDSGSKPATSSPNPESRIPAP